MPDWQIPVLRHSNVAQPILIRYNPVIYKYLSMSSLLRVKMFFAPLISGRWKEPEGPSTLFIKRLGMQDALDGHVSISFVNNIFSFR